MKKDEVLAEAINALIPKSLDNVIRANRNVASLYLSTDEELLDLYAEVTPGRLVDVIDDWRFISLHVTTPDTTTVSLLGNLRSSGHVRITSVVRKVDLDRNLVFTKSGSLYQLGKKGEGEPSSDGLMLICAAFHSWGFGTVLGVPRFYY
jgi:hypothetical protein